MSTPFVQNGSYLYEELILLYEKVHLQGMIGQNLFTIIFLSKTV